jgi:hypothetical protein
VVFKRQELYQDSVARQVREVTMNYIKELEKRIEEQSVLIEAMHKELSKFREEEKQRKLIVEEILKDYV